MQHGIALNLDQPSNRAGSRPASRGRAARTSFASTTSARTGMALAAGALALSLGACSVSNKSSGSGGASASGKSGASASGGQAAGGKTVTLLAHDSWTPDKNVMAEFTKQTGYNVVVQKSGDAGELANKLVLSKGHPSGDVVFGIDNTFASRVAKTGVLADYTSSKQPSSANQYDLPNGQGKGQLSPIDHASVCVNVDNTWFAKHKVAVPAGYDDLVKPTYKNLMVTEGASTSSPGMAFFLSTIAHFGENGWQSYWKKLMSNGLKIDSGWNDAWSVDYTQGGGKGTKPIVVSYDTSPGDTGEEGGKPKTTSLNSTCFQSDEYAGVLTGAKNPQGAKALIDFLFGKAFQQSLPSSMYVLPVDSSVSLPSTWQKDVKIADHPQTLSPDTIDQKRQQWLTDWKNVTS